MDYYKIYKRDAGLNGQDRVVNTARVQSLSESFKLDMKTAQVVLNALSQECGDGLYYMKKIR